MEQAKLVGYFFKVQGYYSPESKPGGRPLRAPVVIGRLIWQPSATTLKRPDLQLPDLGLGSPGGRGRLSSWGRRVASTPGWPAAGS